jgi:DNA-binding sugar fermentation-stimulating protein
MQSNLLFKIDNLIEGQILKRPSKYIKTPYVADVINIDNQTEVLAHTASLGCCGLADIGAKILMSPIINNKKSDHKYKNKNQLSCSYRVYLSILQEKNREIIIGIYPKLAEQIVESALNKNLLSKLKNIQSYKRGTCIFVEGKVDSRFDFTGIDENGIPFIMEVKNVPLADYEDISAKERKNKCYDNRDVNSKVAYFPDGYRKKSTDAVSPRALKHIDELTLIKKESVTRCIMCYVIQRDDVNCFQPSVIDMKYRNAFQNAVNNGVEIITIEVSWNKNGEVYFIRDDLPITPIDV